MPEQTRTEREAQRTEWKQIWRDDHLRWVCGFANSGGADLVYHDVVEGDLFTQSEKARDLLLTKYLKAAITYEDVLRVERYPVPREALREAILNAVIHRDYLNTAPIQIRVYDDRLSIANPAVLPEGWTTATLVGPHTSEPPNPVIANAFFRAGEIEAWGRGIQRIHEACEQAGTPQPTMRLDAGWLWTEFAFGQDYLEIISGRNSKKTPVKTPVKTPERLLEFLRQHPGATLADAALAIDKSLSATERAARRLGQAGRLRYVGPQKGGRWEVSP